MEKHDLDYAKNSITEVLKIRFDIEYKSSLNEFIATNILATETDFIKQYRNNLTELVNGVEKDIDFFDSEKIDSNYAENKILRDSYWAYKKYLGFLNSTECELNSATKVNISKTKKMNDNISTVMNNEENNVEEFLLKSSTATKEILESQLFNNIRLISNYFNKDSLCYFLNDISKFVNELCFDYTNKINENQHYTIKRFLLEHIINRRKGNDSDNSINPIEKIINSPDIATRLNYIAELVPNIGLYFNNSNEFHVSVWDKNLISQVGKLNLIRIYNIAEKKYNELNQLTPDISIENIEFIQLHAIFSCNDYLQRYGKNTLKTWNEIADNVMIETIFKDTKNEVFKIITDNFENLVIDMIAKFKESNIIIDYNSLAPYFGTIISKFREVFPIENREPQIRYFDTRLILFYRDFGVDIENSRPTTGEKKMKESLTFLELFKSDQIKQIDNNFQMISNKSYYDLTLLEFLALITNTEHIYEFVVQNYSEPEDEETVVTGTLNQIKKVILQTDASPEWKKDCLKNVLKLEENTYSKELSDIEIYNYFEKHRKF